MDVAGRIGHPPFAVIDLHISDSNGLGFGGHRTLGTPNQGVHASDQLAHAERLAQVVVGADTEPDEHVRLVGLGRQHQHRYRAGRLDTAAHFESVEPGQHQIEHHHVGIDPGARVDGRRAIGGSDDLVPLAAQPSGDGLGNRGLVVDDENCAAHEN